MPEVPLLPQLRHALAPMGSRSQPANPVQILTLGQREIALASPLPSGSLFMSFDDLKTSLGLEMLRGNGPDMARKQPCAGIFVHHLTRCTMAESGGQHDVPVERTDFKGSLEALRAYEPGDGDGEGAEEEAGAMGGIAGDPGQGPGSRAAGAKGAAGGETAAQQIPEAQRGAEEVPGSAQAEHPPQNGVFPGKISCPSALPPIAPPLPASHHPPLTPTPSGASPSRTPGP